MKTKIVWLAAVLMATSAVPAWAQETDEGKPDETGVEPYRVGIQAVDFRLSVSGEPVERAPVGERVDLRVVFENQGEEAARDAVARLGGGAEGWEVIEGRADLGNLAPGERARADFAFRAPADPQRCYNGGGFEGTITSSLEDQFFYAPVQPDCPGPMLYTSEVRYRGGDGDQLPEPGERLEVIVVLQNAGRDPATDVRGTLTIDHPDVRVIDDTAAWPDIAPEGTARSTTPFLIEISEDAERGEACQGMVVDTGPAPRDGDDPVSSDGTVSSDGSSTDGSGGGGSDGSAGQTEPGSSGPDGGAVQVAPAGSEEPAPPPEEKPVEEQPAEEGTIEPDGGSGGSGGGEEPAETPVAFDGRIAITASGSSYDGWMGSGVACALESRDDTAGGTGTDLGAPVTDARALGESQQPAAGGAGVVPIVLAVLAILAVGFALVRRVAAQRAASV